MFCNTKGLEGGINSGGLETGWPTGVVGAGTSHCFRCRCNGAGGGGGGSGGGGGAIGVEITGISHCFLCGTGGG